MGRADGFQRRHSLLGFPIAVIYKFVEDAGPYLAGVLTYYGLVSLAPWLLLLATATSYLLSGSPDLREDILASVSDQFPVIGSSLGDPKSLGGSVGGVAIGLIGALYGGLGIGVALQYGLNVIWGVPRNSRPNPLLARVRALGIIMVSGVFIVLTTALSILTSALGWAPSTLTGAIALMGTLMINTLYFLFLYKVGVGREVRWTHLLVGAVLAAIAWRGVQSAGSWLITEVIARANDVSSIFGSLLGLVVFLYLTAMIVLLCAEVNVVIERRLWPRALFTPYTDRVSLTSADREAYATQARATRSKGFQRISVVFDPDEAERDAHAHDGSGAPEGR